jgi:hypothetical protein
MRSGALLAVLALAAAAPAAPPAADVALSEELTSATQAIDCPPGSYYYGLVGSSHYCVHCSAGSYSAEGCTNCAVGAHTCSQCPAGSTSASGATSCVKAPACAKGSFVDTTGSTLTCSQCDVGQWQSLESKTFCNKCPHGSYQPRKGMVGCYHCPAGEYAATRGLEWCNKCDQCGGGRYGTTNSTKSTRASDCFCRACAVGQYVTKGYTKCFDCPAGRFQHKEEQQGCYRCLPGQYQPKAGQATCLPCDAGRFQSTPGQSSCLPCPDGLKSLEGAEQCTVTGRENFRAFFGLGDSTAAPLPGWKMLTVVQLNQFAESLRHFYELHGGLQRLGVWASSSCCLATPSGKRLWTGASATSGSFVFPASAGAAATLRCNPTAGYTDTTYRIYGQLQGTQAGVQMSTTTKFFEVPSSGICANSGKNPAIFMRLEPTAKPCAERSVDYGRWRVCITPPDVAVADQRTVRFRLFDASVSTAGYSDTTKDWKLMSALDMTTHQALLQKNIEQRGGLYALASWTAKGCCLAVAGGLKLTAGAGSGKHSYVFPALSTGGIQCPAAGNTFSTDEVQALAFMNPLAGQPANVAELEQATSLKAATGTGACSPEQGDSSPGIYMSVVDGVAEDAYCEVVGGRYLCVEPPSTVNVEACELTQWSTWSTCTTSCGSGNQQRHRALTKGDTQTCGATLTSRICATQDCPVDCVHHTDSWGAWSTCSTTCGTGQLKRSRDIMTPAQNGGLECQEDTETMPCTTALYCPVHCEVSTWGTWSTCTKTCGGGSRMRYRTETRPENHGGEPCPKLIETARCGEAPCAVDCVVSQWSGWGACSATCGAGVNRRTRTVQTEPLDGGKSCGSLSDSRSCTHASLSVCPVDCKVEPTWGTWEACTRTCGGGLMLSRKNILQQASSNGKVQCPAASTLVRSRVCNTHPCAMPMCHAEHVRCHYDHHHLVISHDKRHGIFGKFQCSSKAGYRAPKTHTETVDACKMVKHNFGGECTPLREFKQSAGHVYGFRLDNMQGLKYNGRTLSPKTAVAAHSSGNVALENACLFALAHGGQSRYRALAAKATWSTRSFGIANGPVTEFWQNDAHALPQDGTWTFAEGSGTTKAITDLQCYFSSAEIFRVVDEPKQGTSCVCTCSEHPCCSTKGWTLSNAELEGNHMKLTNKEQCCNMCTNHPNCTAWTFDSDTGTCSLRGGEPQWVRRDGNSWTGTRSQGGACQH